MSAPTSGPSTTNPPLPGPGPARALSTSLVASGQFSAAGANYADLVEIDLALPDDAAFGQWCAGNWECIRSTATTLCHPVPPTTNDLAAFLALPARLAAAEARQPPPGLAPTPALRWVCWVSGCRYICTKRGDVGPRPGPLGQPPRRGQRGRVRNEPRTALLGRELAVAGG